jgi:hypothetical protein
MDEGASGRDIIPQSLSAEDFVGKSLSELAHIDSKEIRHGQGVGILTESGAHWILLAERQAGFLRKSPLTFTLFADPLKKFYGVDKLHGVSVVGSNPGDGSLHTGMITQHTILEMSVPRQQIGPNVLAQAKDMHQKLETDAIQTAGVFTVKDWQFKDDPTRALKSWERQYHTTWHWSPKEWRTLAGLLTPNITEAEIKTMVLEMMWKGYCLGPGENAARIISKGAKPLQQMEVVGQAVESYLDKYNRTHKKFPLERAAALVWWANQLDSGSSTPSGRGKE